MNFNKTWPLDWELGMLACKACAKAVVWHETHCHDHLFEIKILSLRKRIVVGWISSSLIQDKQTPNNVSFLVLKLEYFRDNSVNTMAADVLTLCVARPSASLNDVICWNIFRFSHWHWLCQHLLVSIFQPHLKSVCRPSSWSAPATAEVRPSKSAYLSQASHSPRSSGREMVRSSNLEVVTRSPLTTPMQCLSSTMRRNPTRESTRLEWRTAVVKTAQHSKCPSWIDPIRRRKSRRSPTSPERQFGCHGSLHNMTAVHPLPFTQSKSANYRVHIGWSPAPHSSHKWQFTGYGNARSTNSEFWQRMCTGRATQVRRRASLSHRNPRWIWITIN